MIPHHCIAHVCVMAAVMVTLAGCGTVSESYIDRGYPIWRDYGLDYHETIVLLPETPGVRVQIGDEPVGVTPLTIEGPAGTIHVVEQGFSRVYVARQSLALAPDGHFGERKTKQVESAYAGHVIREPEKEMLVRTWVWERIEPLGPADWSGPRRYAVDVEPVRLTLVRDGEPPRCVEVRPIDDDVVVRAALDALIWNDELRRPTSARGHRVITAANVWGDGAAVDDGAGSVDDAAADEAEPPDS